MNRIDLHNAHVIAYLEAKSGVTVSRGPTSKAAPPPITLSGGGMPEIGPKQPDWNYWNMLPVLSITECTMLLIDIDPREKLVTEKDRKCYQEKQRMIESYQAAGEFPFADADVVQHEFIAWAKSVELSPPEEWDPVDRHEVVEKGGPCWEKPFPVLSEPEDSSDSNWTPLSAIADDVVQRFFSDASNSKTRIGDTSVYNSLIDEPSIQLADRYALPIISYELVDTKTDRNISDIHGKKDLKSLTLQWTDKTGTRQHVRFRAFVVAVKDAIERVRN